VADDPHPYELAAILATPDAGQLYSGLSVLVSTAVDGGRCAALLAFGAHQRLTGPGLEETPPSEVFGRSLAELRDTAFSLDNLTVRACAASVQTWDLPAEPPLAGVMSTPRFLRETANARRFIHV
jgi:hypothetical protein